MSMEEILKSVRVGAKIPRYSDTIQDMRYHYQIEDLPGRSRQKSACGRMKEPEDLTLVPSEVNCDECKLRLDDDYCTNVIYAIGMPPRTCTLSYGHRGDHVFT